MKEKYDKVFNNLKFIFMKEKTFFSRAILMGAVLTLSGAKTLGSTNYVSNCVDITPAELSFDQSSINFDSIRYAYVSDDDIIELETCEGSSVTDIKNLFAIDNRLYVHSGNQLHVFGFDGEYLFDISKNDTIAEENNAISDVVEKNGKLYVDNGKELLCFSREGDLLSTQDFNNLGKNDETHLKKGPNASNETNFRENDIVFGNHKEAIPGVPGFYQIYNGSIFFVFQVSSAETCLCQYNLLTHQSKLYHYNIRNRNLVQRTFFRIIDGVVYIEFRDEEDNAQNPFLLKIELSEL